MGQPQACTDFVNNCPVNKSTGNPYILPDEGLVYVQDTGLFDFGAQAQWPANWDDTKSSGPNGLTIAARGKIKMSGNYLIDIDAYTGAPNNVALFAWGGRGTTPAPSTQTDGDCSGTPHIHISPGGGSAPNPDVLLDGLLYAPYGQVKVTTNYGQFTGGVIAYTIWILPGHSTWGAFPVGPGSAGPPQISIVE